MNSVPFKLFPNMSETLARLQSIWGSFVKLVQK